MTPAIIVHYHEIALKGKNRERFERQLIDNIRWALRGVEEVQVYRMSGRIVLRVGGLQTHGDTSVLRERLHRVFGIANIGIGYEVRQEQQDLEEDVVRVVLRMNESESGEAPKSFAVRVKRSNKAYPGTSSDMERHVGGAVQEATGWKVDLEHPDTTVHVEIVERTAFVFVEKIRGPGGLPVGVSGRVLTLLSSGFDSPVASWKMMRRGCTVDFIHFHSYPYTSDASMRNVETLVQTLGAWQGRATLFLVPLIDFQKEVMIGGPAALRVLLYRRMMFRVAQEVATRERIGALVTGESVGQVASQTIPNIAAVDAVVGLPVLRPLIGDDKQDIIDCAERIGTEEISRRPYDDCCSLFTPDHPATNASSRVLDAAEERLGVDDWVQRVLERLERKIVEPE